MKRNKLLTEDVKKYCRDVLKVDLVGIASSDRFKGAPVGHLPEDLLPGAKSVIVVGLRILSSIVNWKGRFDKSEVIPKDVMISNSKFYTRNYWSLRREIESAIYWEGGIYVLNRELERICMFIAFYLEDAGYESLFLPATSDDELRKKGALKYTSYLTGFSARHAAVLAGLGELGLSGLLLTPKYGPRVRLGTVITTAPLRADPLYKGSLCLGEEKCGLCVKKCPNQAFLNETITFSMNGKKTQIKQLDYVKCSERKKANEWSCGDCIRVCPVGCIPKKSLGP